MRESAANSWRYVIHKNRSCKTHITGRFYDGPWMRLERDGTLLVRAGYAWNGRITAGVMLKLLWRQLDGVDVGKRRRKTPDALLFHDVLYQFGRDAGVRRKEADDLFLQLMTEHRVPWRHAYYGFVRLACRTLY